MILSSWKDIAKYFGRGVRTVQRWERCFGMPVIRPAAHGKSTVCARTEELDAWLGRAHGTIELQQRIRELERENEILKRQLAGTLGNERLQNAA